MRVAVVSDIHGNRRALEAVIADLRATAPDLVLHGGDLADSGSDPAGVVDRIRELGWQGVAGNTDQMLAAPETFAAFAAQAPQLEGLWCALREMAAATREALGEERLAWLGGLPLTQSRAKFALVHASPTSTWRAPAPEASEDELRAAYGKLGRPLVVYGHVHRPFVRELDGLTVANSGSVGLSHDGDPRAAYLVLDDRGAVEIRRIAYDVQAEIAALRSTGFPHAEWVARILESARPQMP